MIADTAASREGGRGVLSVIRIESAARGEVHWKALDDLGSRSRHRRTNRERRSRGAASAD